MTNRFSSLTHIFKFSLCRWTENPEQTWTLYKTQLSPYPLLIFPTLEKSECKLIIIIFLQPHCLLLNILSVTTWFRSGCFTMEIISDSDRQRITPIWVTSMLGQPCARLWYVLIDMYGKAERDLIKKYRLAVFVSTRLFFLSTCKPRGSVVLGLLWCVCVCVCAWVSGWLKEL